MLRQAMTVEWSVHAGLADRVVGATIHGLCQENFALQVEGDPDMSALNATQRRAVAMKLSERVSLMQRVRPLFFLLSAYAGDRWE